MNERERETDTSNKGKQRVIEREIPEDPTYLTRV